MRSLLNALIVVCLMASPVLAADWSRYVNERYGFTLDVASNGWSMEPEPENGDGQSWVSGDGEAEMKVWGANLVSGSFQDDGVDRRNSDDAAGWTITASAGRHLRQATSNRAWFFYTGTKGDRILYQRSMAQCGGSQAIYLRLEYSRSMQARLGPQITHMVKSMKTAPAGACAPANQ